MSLGAEVVQVGRHLKNTRMHISIVSVEHREQHTVNNKPELNELMDLRFAFPRALHCLASLPRWMNMPRCTTGSLRDLNLNLSTVCKCSLCIHHSCSCRHGDHHCQMPIRRSSRDLLCPKRSKNTLHLGSIQHN